MPIGFCSANCCQKRQAASFSFSSMQPPVSQSQWALLLVTLLALNVCRVHTENCFPSADSLDMCRPVDRALSFWLTVNPIEPWLRHTQHFFCLKNDLVRKDKYWRSQKIIKCLDPSLKTQICVRFSGVNAVDGIPKAEKPNTMLLSHPYSPPK